MFSQAFLLHLSAIEPMLQDISASEEVKGDVVRSTLYEASKEGCKVVHLLHQQV
jgi:hypothetical protein